MVAPLTMVAGRYEICLLVFNSVSDLFAAFTCEISSGTVDEKFHITACLCILNIVCLTMSSLDVDRDVLSSVYMLALFTESLRTFSGGFINKIIWLKIHWSSCNAETAKGML